MTSKQLIRAALLSAALAVVAPMSLAPASAATAATAGHQRLAPLEGGVNFRDLGGYRTADGKTVKWGVLFRSGTMYLLTDRDYAYLSKIGFRTVIDFRSNAERKVEPTRWSGDDAPTILTTDYELGEGGMGPTEEMLKMTPEQARQLMAAGYPASMASLNAQYRQMFAQLVAGNSPLVFHCSAGKDRTGVAAALVLTALGVPRETIIQDYLLTNDYLAQNTAIAAKVANSPVNTPWASLPAPVGQAFAEANRRYIEAAFQTMDAHPGGAMAYLRDEMGLSDADVVKLRATYLN